MDSEVKKAVRDLQESIDELRRFMQSFAENIEGYVEKKIKEMMDEDLS